MRISEHFHMHQSKVIILSLFIFAALTLTHGKKDSPEDPVNNTQLPVDIKSQIIMPEGSTADINTFTVLVNTDSLGVSDVPDSTEIYKAGVVGNWTVTIADSPDASPYNLEIYNGGTGFW